jgi:hypothetical protein
MKISHRCALATVLIVASVAALAVTSAAGASEPIRKGVDVWMTVTGMAHTTLADDPIPAGFFCSDSRPFSGMITLKGVPLAVTPGAGLGGVDTVVRRLDDAVFNAKGEATTRIQLMALSLASIEPIETSCGKYDVAVSLAPGEQPTTTMRIFLENSLGGTYSAPLALNTRIVFTPVSGDKSARRELTRRVDLGPGDFSVWAYVTTPRYADGAMIDTRGEGRPNTPLPKASNFQAGTRPAVVRGNPPGVTRTATFQNQHVACAIQDGVPGEPSGFSCPPGQCPWYVCHCAQGSTNRFESSTGCAQDHLHCTYVCYTP